MAQDEYMPIRNWDYIEFYVGNAKQAAHYYRTAFGFTPIAYAGPGDRRARPRQLCAGAGQDSPGLHQRAAPGSPIGEHVLQAWRWREGYRAVRCRDAAKAYQRGHRARRPQRAGADAHEDEYGRVRRSASTPTARPSTPSSSAWTMRALPAGLPCARPAQRAVAASGCAAIDHIVGNVELGKMNEWVNFYEEVMGFSLIIHFDDEDIKTEYSALMSKVMQSGNGKIKFPINEPARGKKKSQIEEYLDYYGGPGAQHSPWPPTTSSRPSRRCRRRACSSCRAASSYYCRTAKGASARSTRTIADLAATRHPGRPRRRRLPAADLHQDRAGSPDALLRGDPAQGRARLRQRQLQGAVRGHRARAGRTYFAAGTCKATLRRTARRALAAEASARH